MTVSDVNLFLSFLRSKIRGVLRSIWSAKKEVTWVEERRHWGYAPQNEPKLQKTAIKFDIQTIPIALTPLSTIVNIFGSVWYLFETKNDKMEPIPLFTNMAKQRHMEENKGK